MIQIYSMRLCMEKEAGAKSGAALAGSIGKVVGHSVSKAVKYWPVTLGLLAAGLVVTKSADRVHDLYDITNEIRKRKIMKHQTVLLNQIARQGKKSANTKQTTGTVKKNIIIPLS